MNAKRLRWCGLMAGIAAILVASFSGVVAARRADGVHAQWNALADDFLDQVYFKLSPTGGTVAGLHQYDSQLEDYSRAGVDREVAAYQAIEKRVEAFDPSGLTEYEAADREMVLGNIRSTLLTLQSIRGWEKNPDNYSSGITESAYYIMNRKYAPTD